MNFSAAARSLKKSTCCAPDIWIEQGAVCPEITKHVSSRAICPIFEVWKPENWTIGLRTYTFGTLRYVPPGEYGRREPSRIDEARRVSERERANQSNLRAELALSWPTSLSVRDLFVRSLRSGSQKTGQLGRGLTNRPDSPSLCRS
jgi:hypothetical protein